MDSRTLGICELQKYSDKCKPQRHSRLGWFSDGIWNSTQSIHQLPRSNREGHQPQTFSNNGSPSVTVDEDYIDGWIVVESPGATVNNCKGGSI
jgi:hypothetical protein